MPRGYTGEFAGAGNLQDKRPKCETALSAWLEATGTSIYVLARRAEVDPVSIKHWAFGQMMPTLVSAFRIERATNGGVPVSSWLGTDLGRRIWKTDKVDWAERDKKVAASQRAYYRRKKMKQTQEQYGWAIDGEKTPEGT